MPATRTMRRGQPAPDKEIFQLFTTLNQQQCEEQNDLTGIYDGRLRSHAQNFEGMKRKWEGFTGAQLPKKLRMSVDPPVSGVSSVAQNASKPAAAKSAQEPISIRATSVPQTTAAAQMPVHADDKINVDNMIVNNLRKELKRRGLSTAGRKAELQKRLREYLTESRQRREADWAKQIQEAEERIKAVKIHESVVQEQQPMDVVMEEAEEEGTEAADEEAKISVAQQPSFKNHSVAPKSALKPSKYTANKQQAAPRLQEEAKSGVQEAIAPPTQQQVNAPPVKVSEESNADSSAAIAASSSTGTTLQTSAQKSKITTLVETPGGAAFKTKPSGAGSAKLLEKKKLHAAQSEARKARMAEMRQKAKPTIGSATKSVTGSQSKYAASAALKKMASSSATVGQSSKSTDILAKMREKAAANTSSSHHPVTMPEAQMPKPALAPASLRHANSMVAEQGSISSSSATSVKKIAAKFAAPVPAAAKIPSYKSTAKSLAPSPVASSQPTKLKTNAKALKSLNDPANKPKPAVAKTNKKPVPEKPLSPKQTYEMSDREEESESESDSDGEYERQRPKKTVPQWAQKSNLIKALEKQYADGPNRLDPDKIFGEVLSCNLDEIFDKKKARYQRRTSSGNWSQDHVTAKEKLAYKRAVGLKI